MHILVLGLLLLQMQSSSVDGIVTKPGGNDPLAGATVMLVAATQGSAPRRHSVMTEEDGRFAVREIPPGDYQLLVESPRYGTAAYGQRHPDGPGVVLSLPPGQRLSDLRFPMPATGVIAGRVSGRNGEPAVKATVQALKYTYQNGKRILRPVQIASTDDRGEYRLFWLPAGRYLVAAAINESPAEFMPARAIRPGAMFHVEVDLTAAMFSDSFLAGNVVNRILSDGTLQEESWVPVYYPSTTEARFGIPIDVASGATMTGVHISIGPAPARRVRGRVTGAPPGSEPRVSLLPQDSRVDIHAVVKDNFEFRGVLPGTYYVLAREPRTGLVSTPLPLEVGDIDIDGLRVALGAGIQIGVTVLLDNPSKDSSGPKPVNGIALRLASDIVGLVQTTNGQSSGGRTSFNNVAPGGYQIEVLPPPPTDGAPTFHVKSVRFGSADANEGIRVTDTSPTRLEIVLTNESGALEGTVAAAGQTLVTGATVVLVPSTGRSRASLYKSAITDNAGRFRFDDIAPGNYKVFAWEDVETGAWQDSNFLRLYETRGRAVTVSANSKEDLQLTLIPKS
jgi:hypothetical protein